MTCLNITDKIGMIIDQMQTSKQMLKDDAIRPNNRLRLEEDLVVLKADLKALYLDLLKVISN